MKTTSEPIPAKALISRGIAASEGPELLFREEDIADTAFRCESFVPLVREHLFVQGCIFCGCLFPACGLRGSRFTDVVFRSCDFSNADLRGCAFQRVEFVDCKLLGTDFSESSFLHVYFERSKADYVNFFGSRFRSVRFESAAMSNAAFPDCRFERTRFSGCDLTLAEFHGTHLHGISLADSDIRGIRVSEIVSNELRGLKVTRLQACDLARMLGVEIDGE